MMKTLAIVQVRSDTERSSATTKRPAASSRKLGGKPLLEWVVRRVTDSQLLDGVIVLATEEERALTEIVPPDVPVFIGQSPDMLRCFRDAIEAFQAESIVRVCADNPFIDPMLIDRLVTTAAAHPKSDYIAYSSREGHPAILSPLGVFAEWMTTKSLRSANRRATEAGERQQVTRHIYTRPGDFSVRFIPIPSELDRDDVRLQVATQEDWEHTEEIYEALGPDECDWQRIAGFLQDQPGLRQRMAVLNRAADA